MTKRSTSKGSLRGAAPPFNPDTSEGLETGLYLALLELIDEGLIITGDEIVFEANSAACTLLKRDYRDLAGRPLAGLFPSEKDFLEARQRLLIQGEMRGNIEVAMPGGKTRWLRFVAAARLRPGLHALIISPADHGSKHRGDSPEAHEDLLWPRLAAAVEQPVIVLDSAQHVATANTAALSTLKLTRRQLLHQPIERHFDLTWSSARGGSLARLHNRDSDETLQARVLPGPRPGWQTLLLPGLRQNTSSGQRHTSALDPLTARLSQAIVHDELEVHFQPLMNVRQNRIVGGEALLRWNHPELGQLPFNRFVQSARSGDLLVELGNWVLRQALSSAATWPRHKDSSGIPLTVNMANDQIKHGGLAQRLKPMLKANNVAPELLELDLDESLLGDSHTPYAQQLNSLRALGLKFAVDDFGQSPTWLPALKHYPVSTIKIAPTLVQGVGHDETSEAIVEAIIGMCDILGVKVLARGVTTAAQRAFLSALGCDLQQGPLFGTTLPAGPFRQLLLRDAGQDLQ